MEKEFKFNEKEHLYTLDGKPMTGVTTILSVIAKPALIQWAANMACDYVDKASQSEKFTLKDLPDILKEARLAHRKKKEDAGSKGTDVHKEIEGIIKVFLLTDGLPEYLANLSEQAKLFVAWAKENKVKFLASEKRVYNDDEKLWYAGTADFVAEIDGKKYVGDTKTSNQIYPEAFYQMAAYRAALERMGETDFAGSVVVNINKKNELKVEYSYFYQEDWDAFWGALKIYKRQNKITN